jgi:hypothetical protein
MTTWTLPGVRERAFGKKAELWRPLLLSRCRCRLENFLAASGEKKRLPELNY